jgi:adenylate cyclase
MASVRVFSAGARGLILADVELRSARQSLPLPWVGAEESGDPRDYNANLVADPFSVWGE